MAERSSRRQALAAGAAVVIVAAALGAILLLGRVSPPQFPSLSATPDPAVPGRVAYISTDGNGRDQRACVLLIPAGGGEATSLRCLEELTVDALTWASSERLVLQAHDALGALELVLGAGDGQVLERRRPLPSDEPPSRPPVHPCDDAAERADGAVVLAGGGLGGDGTTAAVVLVEPDGQERTLVEVEDRARYGSGYRFFCPRFSPDGGWVLVQDDADRLLLVDAPEGGARVLATDVAHAAWAPSS